MHKALPTLFLLPLFLLFLTPGPAAVARGSRVDDLLAELRLKRDNADEALLFELADLKSRPAMAALLEAYDLMQSVYMRRAVVQALGHMDGVADAEQPALQKLMDVATQASDRELRQSAVDTLAECPNLGKAFLAMIVGSAADDDIRLRAMRYHTREPRAQDAEWYRGLYEAEEIDVEQVNREAQREKEKRRGKPAESEEEEVPWPLPSIRVLAFDALADGLGVEEVVEATDDRDARIRERALRALDERKDPRALEIAQRCYERLGPSRLRITGARILARAEGVKLAKDFIKDASRVDTPLDLRLALADILADFGDEKIDKQLVKLVGKGDEGDKLFALRAARKVEDDKLDKQIRKGLKDKDRSVVLATLEAIAERGDVAALPDVEKLAEKSKDTVLEAAVIDAVSRLRAGDDAWIAELQRHAGDADAEVRNAALLQLGKTRRADVLPTLGQALSHELWSTRLAAAHAIADLRVPEGIELLIGRLAQENGRMSHELGEILWELTGQSFGTRAERWRKWWSENAEGFRFVTAEELEEKAIERENARLKQISRTTFFGIRIISHRVTFIIDVSGSMEEPTRGRYVGQGGESRISVAKRELVRALESLDKKSLFNVISFSSEVRSWRRKIAEYTGENLADAKQYVGDFRAGGATNLFGALAAAYDDPDVDTIYVLSDGEPTVDPTDPVAIRGEVARWNRHRDVTIHAISIGLDLAILEALAADTGGTYVHIP